jgi:hypothetical protein
MLLPAVEEGVTIGREKGVTVGSELTALAQINVAPDGACIHHQYQDWLQATAKGGGLRSAS